MLPTGRAKDMLRTAGFDEGVVNIALRVMERREDIVLTNERKTIRKIK